MPRKCNKRKFFQPKPGQEKRLRREELSPGMTGFLVTCSQGNENRSVLESYDLLNEYMDIEMAKLESGIPKEPSSKVTSSETTAAEKKEENPEEPEQDMEKAMADELKSYRTSAGIEERKARFKAVDSGCNNLIFISSAVLDPAQFAFDILKDIHGGKKGRARYIQRLLPVVATCRADIDTVKKTAEKALTKYFSGTENPSYLILYKTRNTALSLTRDDIIAAFGDIVKNINPQCRANLNDPDYAISVDVIKTVCCISVAKDYAKLKKYNVHVDEEQDGVNSHSRVQPKTKSEATVTSSEATVTSPEAAVTSPEANGVNTAAPVGAGEIPIAVDEVTTVPVVDKSVSVEISA